MLPTTTISLLLAALAPHVAGTTTTRYQVTQRMEQEVDASGVGGGKQGFVVKTTSFIAVTLTDSAGNAASTVTGSTGALSGALGAAESAKGMYVFSVPADARNPVTVTVTYSSGAPTLVFTGAVAGG